MWQNRLCVLCLTCWWAAMSNTSNSDGWLNLINHSLENFSHPFRTSKITTRRSSPKTGLVGDLSRTGSGLTSAVKVAWDGGHSLYYCPQFHLESRMFYNWTAVQQYVRTHVQTPANDVRPVPTWFAIQTRLFMHVFLECLILVWSQPLQTVFYGWSTHHN